MGFITQKYLGGICTLIIQMRCLLNALQLWHKCCQHVHMFQAWSNNSHAHEQFYLITKGPGLAALPWVPSLIPGDFCRQILFPILLVVLCSLLLHGDPWATGSDLREGDVSLGMFPWGCCELGHVLGSSAASPVSHTLTELFFSVPHHWAHHSPGKGSCGSHQHRYLFCRTQMPTAGIGTAFGVWVEEGQGSSCPTFTPMNQICVQILFVIYTHRDGLNWSSVQVLHGVKALTRPQILSRWGWD